MKLRLTREADRDIVNILRSTKKLFGFNQMDAYAGIIEDGLKMILQDPRRPACRPQDDIRLGIRSMHLEHVRSRRGSASHLIFFLEEIDPNGEQEIIILSVAHERMMPRRKLVRALREDRGRT